jgi:hypothetical protein
MAAQGYGLGLRTGPGVGLEDAIHVAVGGVEDRTAEDLGVQALGQQQEERRQAGRVRRARGPSWASRCVHAWDFRPHIWFHGFWDMELDLWVGRAGQWVVPAALGQRLLPRRGVGRLVGPPGWSPWGAGVFPECGYASFWKVLVRTSSSRPLLGWSLTRRHSKATPLRDTPFCACRAGLKRPLDLPNGPV